MSDTVELLVGGVIAAAVVGTTIGLVWDELAARFRFWPWLPHWLGLAALAAGTAQAWQLEPRSQKPCTIHTVDLNL